MKLNEKSILEAAPVAETQSKRYSCTICPDAFDEIVQVRLHWSNVHKLINAQVCKICEIPFANKELLQQHKYATHSVLCILCGRGYNSAHQLDDHVDAVHKTSINYPCRVCGMNLTRQKLLIAHLQGHEAWEEWLGQLIFTCAICNAKFPEEKDLRNHVTIHDKTWNSRVTKEQSFRKLKAPKKRQTGRGRR